MSEVISCTPPCRAERKYRVQSSSMTPRFKEVPATDCIVHDNGALILHMNGVVQMIYGPGEWEDVKLVEGCCDE